MEFEPYEPKDQAAAKPTRTGLPGLADKVQCCLCREMGGVFTIDPTPPPLIQWHLDDTQNPLESNGELSEPWCDGSMEPIEIERSC